MPDVTQRDSGLRERLQKLSPEDRAFYERYGRMPPAKKDLINRQLKVGHILLSLAR